MSSQTAQPISVAPDKLIVDESICGPYDPVLKYLLEQVYDDMCPLYFARIPTELVSPFADCTKGEGPQKFDELFLKFAAHHAREISEGQGRSILVYPRNNRYISSDDYHSLYAYKQLRAETIPCWILGSPGVPGPLEIKGPAPLDVARKIVTGAP